MKYRSKYSNAPCVRSRLLYALAKKMYSKNKITRHFFFSYINRFEGGQYYSLTLRKIFRELYDIDVGIGSYGGIFQGGWRPHVKVGNYCSFATGIERLYANHPMDYASTHPIFHLKDFGCCDENRFETSKLIIGNDVWIGVNAIITNKCHKIGDGAVVGAGSIVLHDLEPYGVYAGNPARLIRYRFDESIRKRLIESRWYELTPNQLQPLIHNYISVDDFCNKVNKITKLSSKSSMPKSNNP
ncbi:CatB-related O-acetyltransferase [Ruminococcus sp. FC2018]|uniref:CatB-related O-acetyltransferase n=1 Tax=Ruminococcus sp. FC2018 TaxID=1410617 RepID=UPI00068835DC|nr:CatB-related O-acetyltransferase [Ruminococcus sp. FC2018]